ncbi:hypothetical protein D3C83_09720 [compost metagenome]
MSVSPAWVTPKRTMPGPPSFQSSAKLKLSRSWLGVPAAPLSASIDVYTTPNLSMFHW